MVLDGAFYVSTIVSLMVNGVCCVWQQQVEDETRRVFRDDIRAEFDRIRQFEKDLCEQRDKCYSDGRPERHHASGSSSRIIREPHVSLQSSNSPSIIHVPCDYPTSSILQQALPGQTIHPIDHLSWSSRLCCSNQQVNSVFDDEKNDADFELVDITPH